MSIMTDEFKVRVTTAFVQSNEVYKGEFKTVAELDKISAYVGDYADVYETNTRWQYKNGAWTNTGNAIPTNPAYVEADDASISTKPNTLVQRDEQGHAYFADPNAPEQGATKDYVDNTNKVLADAINQEVATRQQDVSDIQQAHNAEVERATNKENALEASIQELDTKIEAEATRAQQAEADLQTAIDNNAQAINAEQSRAEGQEEALLQRINTLKTDTDAAQANITKSLNDEITRAQQAENALSEVTATKLTRVESVSNKQRAYTVQANGEQAMLDVSEDNTNDTLVKRTSTGQAKASSPIDDDDLTTKQYVDNANKVVTDALKMLSSDIVTSEQETGAFINGQNTLKDVMASVEVQSENLIPFPYQNTSGDSGDFGNGVTYSVSEDGGILFNGIASEDSNTKYFVLAREGADNKLPIGKYTFSCNAIPDKFRIGFVRYYENGIGIQSALNLTDGFEKIIDYTPKVTHYEIFCAIDPGCTINQNVYIKLQSGEFATSYTKPIIVGTPVNITACGKTCLTKQKANL